MVDPVRPPRSYPACVNYTCVNATTGEHRWLAAAAGAPCWPDDPCGRYACDGRGHCAVRRGASDRCLAAAFVGSRNMTIVVTVSAVVFLAIFASAAAMAISAANAAALKEEIGRRKKMDDYDK